jgi:hypothetical protein
MARTIIAAWTEGLDQAICKVGSAIAGITGGPKNPVNHRITNRITITVNNMSILLSACLAKARGTTFNY